MIPLRDVIPSRTTPYITITIIVINALAWLFEVSLSRDVLPVFLQVYGVVPKYFQPTTLITSMFLHGSWSHVIGNMWYLWIFGDNVEDRVGHGRFIVFYLLCGMCAAAAQIAVSVPGSEFRIAGGPYTVPLSISGASRISTVTLTLTFNQAALRVRMVQEGSFMRQGGATPTFTQQVDATIGRIDLVIARTGDVIGASGAGLLTAIVFDAIGAGPVTLSLSGVATGAGGTPAVLNFTPASVVVR